ncbi:hypothetical protein DPMN_124939 [Dreissena polymorpha]|uniref:Uncharacterized protein n=1 Tax=Dreissena polymorpha TaxID=45954 RepID=A0A9D4GWX6_DREPO|nr:hypothetical protein DPMN_124939 [Dreissena polymorpha]
MDLNDKTNLAFLLLVLTFAGNISGELPKCNVTTSNELVPYCSFSSWFAWDCRTCGVNYHDNQAMAVRKRALCCSQSDQGIVACLSECQQSLGSNQGYGKCDDVCPVTTTTATPATATSLTQSTYNVIITESSVHSTNRTTADSTSDDRTYRMITTETSEHAIYHTTVIETATAANVTSKLTDFHGATQQTNDNATCSFGSIIMKKGPHEKCTLKNGVIFFLI